MIGGLNSGCRYVHSILKEEAQLIKPENVVLWGFSQGCATSLTSLLTWEGKAFGAVVGMCGYLPFGNHFKEIASLVGPEDERPKLAVEYLRRKVHLENDVSWVCREVPVFLGHGSKDPYAKAEIMREAERCLKLIGVDVTAKEYAVAHDYSPEMVSDIFAFLKAKLPQLQLQ
jgi:predicted esterase